MGDILQRMTGPTVARGLIDDIFTRPDTASLGYCTYVGGQWQGSGRIIDELADPDGFAWINTTVADVEITAKIFGGVNIAIHPIVFRYVDDNNHWRVAMTAAGVYALQCVVEGVPASRGNSGTIQAQDGDSLRLVARAGTIVLYVNGLEAIRNSTNTAEFRTATRHGFASRTTAETGHRWAYYRAEPAAV